ncbi:MAG: glycosyltransferase [Dehalococcoidia bacterium]
MRKPIKVFVLIKGLEVGGAEKLLTTTLPCANRDDFEYEVGYLVPGKDALSQELEQQGIPVFCLGQSRFYDMRVILRLAKLLRQRQVDILHIHLPFPGIIGRIAGRLAGVSRIVYSEHSPVHRYHALTRLASRLTYSWNDAVIAVSNEVYKSVEQYYGSLRRSRLLTIYNGIEDPAAADPTGSNDTRESVRQELGIPEGNSVVINVAGFRPEKGHFRLLQAAELVLPGNPQVTFLLVGQGETEEAVRAEVSRLGLEKSFVFAGFRNDIPRLPRASDLFLLASDYEGLPVSLLEAMGAGLPSVSTRVGGVPEVVEEGVEGLMVSPEDPEQMAEAVLRLLGDADTRLRMGQAGLDRVNRQFSVQRMVDQTEGLYRELLASA